MTLTRPILLAAIGACVFSLQASPASCQAITPVPGTTTRDIPFMSHDGYPMLGRLTLPDTPGPHPVMLLVQTAEAQAKDGQLRNAKGERVPVYTLYRANLAPLGIGFFSYEGRGVSANAGGGPVIDRTVYDTSTLANKVQDGIAAVRLLQKQPDVDRTRIVLRGISEGTLLAAEIAVQIPSEVRALVLSGVIGSSLKDSLVFMTSDGAYMRHLGFWDGNRDGRISQAEWEADPQGIRKQLPAGTQFRQFDFDNDGFYTRTDAITINKPLTDAVRNDNFDVYMPWLEGSAAAQTPKPMLGWVKDHLSQPTMWDLLAKLSMPVGLFQGEIDANTSAEQVRALEQKAKAAGRTNLEFRYYEGLDHGLGTIEYFNKGTPSTGYAAIFEFMKRVSAPAR
jgi:pimeloyl-ACP methyl ester carboxylesterase